MAIIIQATTRHLDMLVPLFDAYRVFYQKPSNPGAARSFLEERLQNEESVIYLAVENDKAIGFTQLYPLFSSTRMQRLWLLNDLYVSPAYRGRSISKQLIDKAKELVRATNAAGLQLETAKDNHIGNRLYPAVDFELNTDFNFYFWVNQ